MPDGLRRVLVDGAAVLVFARGGELYALDRSLAQLLAAGRDELHAAIDRALQAEPISAATELLAPVDEQEVWASGVTYRRSATARVEESSVGDVYEMVYEAQRPELFLKATPSRVPRPGAPLRIRADSGWDVPEPELALVLDARGEVVGYLVADDVSSRTIEGANPLYLPQAKIYDDSLGLSGTIVLAHDAGDVTAATIEVQIERDGASVFEGATSVSEMKRGLEELATALFTELSHPSGAVLLTGTGVVPPDEFTLEHGDRVRIAIDGVGVLEHDIYRKDAHGPDADR
ncbi:MAG: 2-dehydro-3-deoxy-D-arabinonate dehydratase [Solirubrobacteraceae bacterium]